MHYARRWGRESRDWYGYGSKFNHLERAPALSLFSKLNKCYTNVAVFFFFFLTKKEGARVKI